MGFGGATQPVAMPWLKSNGFATVINLRYATEPGADVEGNRAAAEAATNEAKLIAGKPDHAIPFATEYLAKHGKTAAAK